MNLRHWMERLISAGARVALPVVVARATPLVFRPWTTDCEMEQGVWKIPVPVDGPEVTPNILLTPLVGWDEAAFRLGHGGDGYFDRTLAAIAPPPITIATAFEISRVPTTHPQSHDILMDLVVTEAGVQGLEGRVLQQLDLAHAAARLQALALARGLPRQQGAGR